MAIPAVVQTSPMVSAEGQSRAERLLAAFLARRSPATLRAYRGDLEAFARFLGLPTVEAASERLLSCEPGEANELAIRFQASMIEAGLAPATVNRRITAVRSLTRMGRRIGAISWALDVDSVPQERYRDTRGPGVENVTKMVQHVRESQNGPIRTRNLALLALLFDHALRRGEIVVEPGAADVDSVKDPGGLRLCDVDLAEGSIMVLGKGRAQRKRITLTPNATERLREWIEVRGDWPGPLFTSLARGGDPKAPFTSSGLYKLVKALGRAIGVDTRPHGFRHTSITEALRATGGNVAKVQRFSRHADVGTVMIYSDNLEDAAGDVSRLVSSSVWAGGSSCE